MMNQAIADELSSYATPDKIPDYMRFFKTGKGEYAEGDKFLGIKIITASLSQRGKAKGK